MTVKVNRLKEVFFNRIFAAVAKIHYPSASVELLVW